MTRKGIILAGGTGTRLYPNTISVSKQLLPVFDKPMIYYPLSVLMQAGMKDVLVITTPHDLAAFQNLLGDGTQWGMNIEFAAQPSPDGLAQALIIAEDFLGGHPSALILGDNLFFGEAFNRALSNVKAEDRGATVFGYHVNNPSDYGVVGFDDNHNAVSLIEKPAIPMSNYAVTGLYFYDNRASDFAKQVTPSARGELEITALNHLYLDEDNLNVVLLDDGSTWLDTGTHRSLLQASQFVSVIEARQGIKICCPEVIAYRKGWIDTTQLDALAAPYLNSGYGKYLKTVAQKKA